MAELLRYCGFVMVFSRILRTGRRNNLKSYADGLATRPEVLYLAADGSTSLDLAANNTTALHLARDCNDLVNHWTIETALQQVEITVYLAPRFTPSADDAPTASLSSIEPHEREQ